MKMNKMMITGVSALGAAAMLSAAQTAQGQITVNYDATVTPINGSGNESTGWSLLTDSANGIQIGSMGEFNYPSYPNNATQPADPSNGSGTYLFPTGNKPGSLTRSQADLWFSINSGSVNLADSLYNFYIQIDGGPSYNLLTTFTDDSYGNNSTAVGGGIAGTPATDAGLQANYNIAQNAEDVVWLDPSFNPNVGGTEYYQIYDVLKSSPDQSAASATDDLNVQIQIGPVPEPSTFALAGIGGISMLMLVSRRTKATV